VEQAPARAADRHHQHGGPAVDILAAGGIGGAMRFGEVAAGDGFEQADQVGSRARAVQFCSSNAWDRAKRVLTGVEAA
jgi:hypothetical protein